MSPPAGTLVALSPHGRAPLCAWPTGVAQVTQGREPAVGNKGEKRGDSQGISLSGKTKGHESRKTGLRPSVITCLRAALPAECKFFLASQAPCCWGGGWAADVRGLGLTEESEVSTQLRWERLEGMEVRTPFPVLLPGSWTSAGSLPWLVGWST